VSQWNIFPATTLTLILLTCRIWRAPNNARKWQKGFNSAFKELELARNEPSNNFNTFSYRMRWAGHVARMGEERGAYRVLVGKPEGKRPMGRPRRRWVDNIRMDLQEVGCGYMDWTGLAQDRDR